MTIMRRDLKKGGSSIQKSAKSPNFEWSYTYTGGSNPWPPAQQTGALPTELLRQNLKLKALRA